MNPDRYRERNRDKYSQEEAGMDRNKYSQSESERAIKSRRREVKEMEIKGMKKKEMEIKKKLGEGSALGEENIGEYLEALSAKTPVPSGGGVTALSASLAFSLALMVGNLTLGKKKYVNYEERLKLRMQEWEEGRKAALRLAKADEEAFMPLAKVYALPKETEDEKKIYREKMEECLDRASLVPLTLLTLCAENAESFLELAKEGSKLLLSDVGIAASLMLSAMRGSALNVRINTKLMQNEERKKEREEAVEAALKQCELLEKTVREVEKRI